MRKLILIVGLTLILASCNAKSDNSAPAANGAVQQTDSKPAAVDEFAPIPQDLIPVTGPTVVDFYATWCGPCKQLAPILEQFEQKYDGIVSFIRIDVDQEPDLAEAFQVESIPTLFFITPEGVVDASIGLQPESYLEAKITVMLDKSH